VQYANCPPDAGPNSDAKAEECVTALFLTNPIDDRAKHISFKGRVIPGICTWISKNETYITWDGGANGCPQLLWLSGGPGMGKTMLSIFLTQELEQKLRGSNNTLLLYYFCDGRDEKRNTAICLLRGLIFQLIQQQQGLVKILLQDYRVQKENLFKDSSLESLWRVFENMIRENSTKRIYCILDGLDECKNETLQHFLKKIRIHFESAKPIPNATSRLTPQTANKSADDSVQDGATSSNHQGSDLRMLIVSRDGPNFLSKELSGFPHVQLSSETLNDFQSDLKGFIDIKAQEVSVAIRSSTASTASISTALREKGEGNFLWVVLAAERLKRSTSNDLSKDIRHLPSRVDDMYYQTLLSIPDSWKHLVATMLRWIVVAVRPLKLEELEIAIGQSAQIAINRNSLKQIIDLCGNLVAIRDGEVSLVHQSTKDFLLRPDSSLRQDTRLHQFHMSEEATHSEIAQACIAYLQGGSLANAKSAIQVLATSGSTLADSDQKYLAKFPLLTYAVINWTEHASQSPLNGLNTASPFFAPKSAIRRTWWETYWKSTRSKRAWSWTAPTSFSLLHLAAYFGILPIAVYLDNNGLLKKHLAERDSHGARPLHYSVTKSRFSMTVFMLDKGALNIPKDKLDIYEGPNILAAAKSGDHRIVSLLLDRGETVDSVSNVNYGPGTAGMLALRFLPAMVNYFSEEYHRGDWRRDMRDYGDNETVLHIAASCGHDSTMMVLIRRGANVNGQTTGGWTPLHNASWYGKNSNIRTLLAHRADIGAECKDKWTPLHCAAHEGQTESLRILLEMGAPIEAKSTKEKTALHVASYEGIIAVVGLLLDHHADTESKTIVGATPLHLAVWADKEDVVKCLLDHGADRNAVNNKGATPLMLATNMGRKKMATLLQTHTLPTLTRMSDEKEVEFSSPSSPSPTSPTLARSPPTINEAGPVRQESLSHALSSQGGLEPAETSSPDSTGIPSTSLNGNPGDTPSRHSSVTEPFQIRASTNDYSTEEVVARPAPQSHWSSPSTYNPGMVPMPTPPPFVSSTSHLNTTSLSDISDPLNRLSIQDAPSPIQSQTTQFSSINVSPPVNSASHQNLGSHAHEFAAEYAPPSRFSGHPDQQVPDAQVNSYFPATNSNASVTLLNTTSPINRPPIMHASPPSLTQSPPSNYPPTYASAPTMSPNSSYIPSSYPPLPQPSVPSQVYSSSSYNSMAPYGQSPPPLPPKANIQQQISPHVRNSGPIYGYQQPLPSQTGSPYPHSSGPMYSQLQPEQQPHFNWQYSSPHSPHSHYLDPSQGLAAPPAQPPSPYMPPINAATPSPYLNLSYGSNIAYGQTPAFAPPPVAQTVRKSRSFLDLNIMGKKIL
jgi:ankyrin repeat protein